MMASPEIQAIFGRLPTDFERTLEVLEGSFQVKGFYNLLLSNNQDKLDNNKKQWQSIVKEDHKSRIGIQYGIQSASK